MHWKGLYKSYRRLSKHEALTQSCVPAILITACIAIAAVLSPQEGILPILRKIAELAISIFPSLTGLAFAGYTIVIGTISPAIIKRMSKRPPDEKTNSLLEDCNAVFSFMLLIAIITLFLSFIIIIMIECQWKTSSFATATVINLFTVFILTYAICITFRSMLSVIINVFNFGQYIEFDANKPDSAPIKKYGVCKFFSKILN